MKANNKFCVCVLLVCHPRNQGLSSDTYHLAQVLYYVLEVTSFSCNGPAGFERSKTHLELLCQDVFVPFSTSLPCTYYLLFWYDMYGLWLDIVHFHTAFRWLETKDWAR